MNFGKWIFASLLLGCSSCGTSAHDGNSSPERESSSSPFEESSDLTTEEEDASDQNPTSLSPNGSSGDSSQSTTTMSVESESESESASEGETSDSDSSSDEMPEEDSESNSDTNSEEETGEEPCVGPEIHDGDFEVTEDTVLESHLCLREVTGYLKIQNTTLFDLKSFRNLEKVGKSILVFDNSHLESLQGLEKLIEANRVSLLRNPKLTDLRSLSSIRSLTSFTVEDNDSLSDITSLQGKFVGETRTGDNRFFGFYDNDSLIDLDGLAAITTIDGYITVSNNPNLVDIRGLGNIFSGDASNARLEMGDNDALENLDGLENLTSAHTISLQVMRGLKNLDALANLRSVEWLYLMDLPVLENLDGLSALESIGHVFTFGGCYPEDLRDPNPLPKLAGSPLLKSLAGLESLRSVLDFRIGGHAGMESLLGANSLVDVTQMQVYLNPSLPTTDAQTFVDSFGLVQSIVCGNKDGEACPPCGAIERDLSQIPASFAHHPQ